MSIIKTPDQRVRVFISSTINELAEERIAARSAIESLKLIPVFFEAGARPHPPRDLYSAYLSQSHIFLGIYWNSYGWIAPGAEISGLEDEYRLCGKTKPKLIYVKNSTERQEKLDLLLQDISNSDSACYQKFNTADELKQLIENDLSVLMSEIFESSLISGQGSIDSSTGAIENRHDHPIIDIPLIKSEMIGRERDLQLVSELLLREDTSLITILGAGGTGKTTLATFIGQANKDKFKDGVLFIQLAAITNSKLVVNTIGEKLGIQDNGKHDLISLIIDLLTGKQFLLILDNFEQVVDASVVVSQLINQCKDLKVLVTSRSILHIRNERIYHLATLNFPVEESAIAFADLQNYAATKLFLDRAQEVNQNIENSKENAEAILEICQRMDGLPLAIELAAARTRFFQPAALLGRITKTLDLVNKGHKDLPERQQTLRGAIEWSYNLLSPDTQSIFRQMAVFKRSWTMEAADAILVINESAVDAEEYTERLLDVSLIKTDILNKELEPRFNMLQTVHEYAGEMLAQDPDCEKVKLQYAKYFLQLCEDAEPYLWNRNGAIWLDRIESEYQNIRASFYIFMELGLPEMAWRFFPCLAPYWTIRGGFTETVMLIKDAGLYEESSWTIGTIDPVVHGRALTWSGYCLLFVFDLERGFAMLQAAQNILTATNDIYNLTYAYCFDGCYGAYMQKEDAEEKILKGFELLERQNNPLINCMFYCWSDEYFRQKGQPEIRDKNLNLAASIAKEHGITYIQGAVMLIRATIATSEPEMDSDKLIQIGQEMFMIFPEKGYQGFKAASKQFQAIGYLNKGDIIAARNMIKESAEFVKLSGELESEFYLCMLLVHILALGGDRKHAFSIFGALHTFIEQSQYPVIGGAAVQYQTISQLLQPYEAQPECQSWFESGKSMPLTSAVNMGLAQI